MPSNFLFKIFNFLLPPRRTEVLVAQLTLEDLLSMQSTEGLPYAESQVQALVWELKYYANPRAASLGGALLAEELLALAAEELGRPLLVPVPMHKSRRYARGHNQTELLCEAALEALDKHAGKNSLGAAEDFFDGVFDYKPTALQRTTLTPEQQKLDRAKRLKNVAGSMQADQQTVQGRVCVVVDDVTTTGATLAEAKRALAAAGATRVHTLALSYS